MIKNDNNKQGAENMNDATITMIKLTAKTMNNDVERTAKWYARNFHISIKEIRPMIKEALVSSVFAPSKELQHCINA